eukprot:12353960-Alexandrium_andersonii.AAC.1
MLDRNLEQREAEVRNIEGGAHGDGVDIKLPRGARFYVEKANRDRRWGDAWCRCHGGTDPIHPQKEYEDEILDAN